MVIAASLLMVGIGFLLGDRKPVPAKAQAQQLFELYFEMDPLRQESAKIFAELIMANRHPEQVGIASTIGSNPPLSSPEELARRVKENQISIEQNLAVINAQRFSDPEVDARFEAVHAFYTSLFEFEEFALAQLSNAGNNRESNASLANMLFEGGAWTALLDQDTELADALVSLAVLHGLEFTPVAYQEVFRVRLVELDMPIISDEVTTYVYPFTVDRPDVIEVVIVVDFNVMLSDKITVTLEDPRGHVFSSDQLVQDSAAGNINKQSFIYRDQSVIGIKLFPDDPLVAPIFGDWKLHITAPVGSGMTISMIQK